jgi:hypothetical protein
MVQPPCESTLDWCRKLLTGKHEVLVFSPKEDSRRLEEVGLLPGLGCSIVQCLSISLYLSAYKAQLAKKHVGLEGACLSRRICLTQGVDQSNWLDLQRLDWGLGNQPGLQAVATRLHGLILPADLQVVSLRVTTCCIKL